jgi:hypothetical protein
MDSDTKRRVIEFWRALEYLNISSLPKPSSRANIRDIATDAEWPWHSRAYRSTTSRDGATTVWSHIVYLAVCPAEPIVHDIFRAFDEDPNDLGRRLPSGHIACAALVVDANGAIHRD